MERTSERVMYRCRLCRHQLFDSSCVLNPAPAPVHHRLVVGTTSMECPFNQLTSAPPPSSSTPLSSSYSSSSSSHTSLPLTSTSSSPAPFTYSPSPSIQSSSSPSIQSSSSPSIQSSSFPFQSISFPSTSVALSPNSTPLPPLSSASFIPCAYPLEGGQGMAKPGGFYPSGRGPSTSSGVLAPFGQVTAGPNPLWFIDEDSTPPWVQRAVDKYQWKKGKLSCPKCYGRVGSFDFVTPNKLHCSRRRASRIHIMRSRVDCESASPIIARIRPMPQSKLPENESAIFSEGQISSPVERNPSGVEASSRNKMGINSNVVLTRSSVLSPRREASSEHLIPEFSSASDEETTSPQSNSLGCERGISCSSGEPSHIDQSQTLSSDSLISHIDNSNLMNPRCNQNHARRRILGSRTPVDRLLTYGLQPSQPRNDSVVSSPAERTVAYISATNRMSNQHLQGSSRAAALQCGTSQQQNFIHANRENEFLGWHYEGMVDAPGDERQDENVRFCSSHATTSTMSTSTISRPADVSANIFKNSQALLQPLISRGFPAERSKVPSSSQPSDLYSQVQHSEQTDSSGHPSRESKPIHQASPGTVRDSDEDDDIIHGDDYIHHNESCSQSVPQRTPGEQRKERNRKKKERKKQRRYERWLERQTLGAEEESAIQDISAAGLYSLLGPRCAGSSLREVTTCSVCLDIYYQPHTCYPCEHIFCEPCLRQVARFHPVVTPCPLCRTTIRTVKLHDQLTSAVKQLFPRQFENRHQMERRTLNRSFPLPGNANLLPWYRMGYHQNNRNQVDFLASRRNPGYVHDWGMRYLQGVVWRVVASTIVLLVVSGISVGFLHFMFDFS